jgi:uncharacterized repeat protein (TIGR03803 family)
MTTADHHRIQILGVGPRTSAFAQAWAMLLMLILIATPSAQAQTLTVLHSFSAVADGAEPVTGLTMDQAGNLYGTTLSGGSAGFGTIFKLTRKNSTWVFTPLYSFQGGSDGTSPQGRVAIGPDGSLFGTTVFGGNNQCSGKGCGTIFNLRPQAAACKTALCPWTETVLYRFTGLSDGSEPVGDLVFDQQGNLYGGSSAGAYQLTPSYGGWTLSILSQFGVRAGVILDNAGNLYGTNTDAIYQLTPSPDGWIATVLHVLGINDGYDPGGLIFDQGGNLYGGNFSGGPSGAGGTVFELSPSNGGWTYQLLYAFSGSGGPYLGSLVLDAAGNLYGTTIFDGLYDDGSVFKLTPSNGGWAYTDLYNFQLGSSYGCFPNNSLVLDPNGNLYGTTEEGGSSNKGVVFEITP